MRILSVIAAAVIVSTGTTAIAEPSRDQATQPELVKKIRLYAFFATWCVPCRVELPHVQRLADTYRDRGLEVVLVSEDAPSTAANIPAFLARHQVRERWILDDESQLIARYNQTANLPFTAIVDASGSLLYAHPGYEPGDEALLEKAILENLGEAATKGLDFQFSGQNLGVYRPSRFDPVPENDGLLQAAVTRLEASLFRGDFSAAVRIDAAIVSDEISGDDSDAELERARASDSFGPLTLTAGDDYASIGRGVSLSLRKVDPLGLDTALRGGKARLELSPVTVTALAGVTNPQNLDPLDLRILDPPSDLIAATEVEVDLGAISVAPYGLYVAASEAGAGGEDAEWITFGTAATFERDATRATVEAAGGRRTGIAIADEMPLALYASAQSRLGRVTGLLEAKAYRDWSIGRAQDGLLYHEAPTLEREDQEVPGNENALGARGRVSVEIASGLSGFVNLLHYRYADDGSSATDGSNATHAYAGAAGKWRELSWSGQTGYRRENDDGGNFKLDLVHFDADLNRPITQIFRRTIAATLKWNHREERKQLFSRFSFRRGLMVAGISIAGVGALSALYGYSTERRDGTAPTHYPGAELAAQLPRGGTVKIFAGRLTGGRVCVSGSCRDVPPFEGLRLDLVIRY